MDSLGTVSWTLAVVCKGGYLSQLRFLVKIKVGKISAAGGMIQVAVLGVGYMTSAMT